ncbi:hypothetical protein HDU92_000707, partial [Lobulomyces angularis]
MSNSTVKKATLNICGGYCCDHRDSCKDKCTWNLMHSVNTTLDYNNNTDEIYSLFLNQSAAFRDCYPGSFHQIKCYDDLSSISSLSKTFIDDHRMGSTC